MMSHPGTGPLETCVIFFDVLRPNYLIVSAILRSMGTPARTLLPPPVSPRPLLLEPRRRRCAWSPPGPEIGQYVFRRAYPSVRDVLFRCLECNMESATIIILEVVPPLDRHEFHLGALGEIGRIVNHQPTTAYMCLQRNHLLEE